MKHLFNFLFVLLVSTVLVISCEEEKINPVTNPTDEPDQDPVEEPVYTAPSAFNISDAMCLVQIDQPQTKSAYGINGNGNSNFYKITGNGRFLKVSLLDENNEEVADTSTVIDVMLIFQLNEDYFVLHGWFSWLNEDEERVSFTSLLVNKNDGALYDFGGDIDNVSSFRYMNEEFRSDKDGNIYYIGTKGNDDLQRLSIGADGEIFKTKVMPDGQYPGCLEIDKEGNLMYCNNGEFSEGRYIPTTGGIVPFELENNHQQFRGSWVGKNGKIHLALLPSENNENEEVFIYELGLSEGEITYTKKGFAFNNSDIHFDQVFFTNELWRIEQESNLIFIRKTEPAIIRVAEDSMEFIKAIPLQGDIEMAAYSENYFYSAKGTKLMRISLNDFSIDELLPENSYDIYDITLGASDTLTVSALRFSDAKLVYFDLSPDGNISVIDESSGTKAVSLVRLN